jgi:hypothetical protein
MSGQLLSAEYRDRIQIVTCRLFTNWLECAGRIYLLVLADTRTINVVSEK